MRACSSRSGTRCAWNVRERYLGGSEHAKNKMQPSLLFIEHRTERILRLGRGLGRAQRRGRVCDASARPKGGGATPIGARRNLWRTQRCERERMCPVRCRSKRRAPCRLGVDKLDKAVT